MTNNIMVERETFESNGKTYFGYFIKGVVRGKDIRIQIVPPNKDTDKGGYNVLDVVFGDAMQAELVVKYYVSLLLKELSQTLPSMIFKGGTSLSKCHKVIKLIEQAQFFDRIVHCCLFVRFPYARQARCYTGVPKRL